MLRCFARAISANAEVHPNRATRCFPVSLLAFSSLRGCPSNASLGARHVVVRTVCAPWQLIPGEFKDFRICCPAGRPRLPDLMLSCACQTYRTENACTAAENLSPRVAIEMSKISHGLAGSSD